MLTHFGFLDDVNIKSLNLLSEEPKFKAFDETVYVAAVETSPGEFYLHGCENQRDIDEIKLYYPDIARWYQLDITTKEEDAD